MGNNPVNFNDPTGHCADPLTGTACAVIIGLGVLAVAGIAYTIAYISDPNVRESADQAAATVVQMVKHSKSPAQIVQERLENVVGGDDPFRFGECKTIRCRVTVGIALVSLVGVVVATGGYGEPETNTPHVRYDPTEQLKKGTTSTSTPTPTYTPTSTSTRTPTYTPTRTPIYTSNRSYFEHRR